MSYKKASAHFKRAALYIRVSTRYQVDKDSLPYQEKKLREYLSYLGITDYELFKDDGYSAKNTNRPEYQRMMSAVRSGQFTHLIVMKLDRISRNLLDFAAMYEELKKNHVTFISLNEQFDTSTAMGEAMLKIILVFAELERKIDSERVTGIMLNRAEEGLWNGGHVPYGYRMPKDGEGIFPVPDTGNEAEIVKKIFDFYEENHSATQVMRWLQVNVRSRKGGAWTSKMVHDMIRNPFYIGTYRYNVRETARGKIKDQSEWIVRENNHIPIISPEQFNRCNGIMDQNAASRNTAEYREGHVHTFSGLLRCSSCGSGFMASKDRIRANGFRPSVYRCTKRSHTMDCNSRTVSEALLGPFILQYAANMIRIQKNFSGIRDLKALETELLKGNIFEHITGIETEGLELMYTALSGSVPIGRYHPEIRDGTEFDNDNLSILLAEKEKQEKALQRLMDLYLYDPESITPSELSSRKKEIRTKLQEINSRIQEMNLPDTDISDQTEFIRKASAFLIAQKLNTDKADYLDLVMVLDNEILKDFFNQIIEYIEIDQGRISAICFKNGLIHRFIYRENLGSVCRLCGGQIHHTVGCRTHTLTIDQKKHKRIRVTGNKCSGCGAEKERCHHLDCPEEICPVCNRKLSSCIHHNTL